VFTVVVVVVASERLVGTSETIVVDVGGGAVDDVGTGTSDRKSTPSNAVANMNNATISFMVDSGQ
jgi:hypothetical protein